jgi:hypothetical protein
MCPQIEYFAGHLYTQFIHSLLRMNGLNSSPMKKTRTRRRRRRRRVKKPLTVLDLITHPLSVSHSNHLHCNSVQQKKHKTIIHSRSTGRFSESQVHSFIQKKKNLVCLSLPTP